MPRLELTFLHSANGGGCNAPGCARPTAIGIVSIHFEWNWCNL
jgi:hypothetical protein